MKLLDAMMRRFVAVGTLRIVDADGVSHVYAATPAPSVTIRLTDRRLHRALFLTPELRTGEAYMDGTLVIEAACHSPQKDGRIYLRRLKDEHFADAQSEKFSLNPDGEFFKYFGNKTPAVTPPAQ